MSITRRVSYSEALGSELPEGIMHMSSFENRLKLCATEWSLDFLGFERLEEGKSHTPRPTKQHLAPNSNTLSCEQRASTSIFRRLRNWSNVWLFRAAKIREYEYILMLNQRQKALNLWPCQLLPSFLLSYGPVTTGCLKRSVGL